ncbi:MAG: hypothetical protein AMJ79_01540 [Phycisphaerae bacterium SM23_30]|nr:MAG: hypothetical protein AMJ79_01540 [Phycisphaerae bacterium SM23_30]
MEPEKILSSLEKDAELVSPRIREWWLNYLHEQHQRYLDILAFLIETGSGGEILEIGSVPAHLTVLLKKLGYSVRGVDIDPERVRGICRRYSLDIAEVDIETQELPFPDDSFNTVLFTDMLEHLRINPVFTLRQIYRVLQEGGKIILSTPNITPAQRFRFFLYGDSYQDNLAEELKKLQTVGHMGHFRLYILSEVRQLLESVGFRMGIFTYKGGMKRLSRRQDRLLYWVHPRKERFRETLYVAAQKV